MPVANDNVLRFQRPAAMSALLEQLDHKCDDQQTISAALDLLLLHGDLPKEQQAVTLKMLQQLNRMPLEHQRYFLSLLKSLRR